MAAGLGFKTFNTGEVLTSADVNGYLMQGVLVFASEAARDAAITSPQEGQFAYTKDNNSLWYYTGSAWAASGATGDIEGVTAGTGISGGGTSGTVTITNSMATAIDAKGDLVVGTGADTFARLAVGTNGHTLVADSAETTGLKWQAAGSTAVGVLVNNTASSQNVANATDYVVTFNNEVFDTDGFHDNSTNNSRLTVPSGQGGKYLLFANSAFADQESTTGYMNAYFQKNGSTISGQCQIAAPILGFSPGVTIVTMLDLVATDYIELLRYQNSGGTRTLMTGSSNTRFGMTKIGA